MWLSLLYIQVNERKTLINIITHLIVIVIIGMKVFVIRLM